jgi:hypothetical protein
MCDWNSGWWLYALQAVAILKGTYGPECCSAGDTTHIALTSVFSNNDYFITIYVYCCIIFMK